MSHEKTFRSIGLMSGTSMDAMDVALLETDGDRLLRAGPWLSRPYPPKLRHALLELSTDSVDLTPFERQVTDAHVDVVRDFCRANRIDLRTVDCIGFHGQTIKHEPRLRRTWQLGDGAAMANALNCVVINRFRDADLRDGGQGAPFAPAYHRALVKSQGLTEPLAVLNIGGVSNVTLIMAEEVHAFDSGPGNALLDDWIRGRSATAFDADGSISARGVVDEIALSRLMDHPYFAVAGTKSLDRNEFSADPVRGLSLEDGAATLVAFTARAIATAERLLPARPASWIVVGGGRLNPTLLTRLRSELGAPVLTAEAVGWSGDAIEAQAFAYLAVRSILGLPLSWPTTTGVSRPLTGGVRQDPAPRGAPTHHHP